jgi:hypothetical protein
MKFNIDGDEQVVRAGEEIEVGVGVVHQVWNPHAEPATVAWETIPAGRTESWFRALDALNRRAGGKTPGPLDFAPVVSAYRDTFRLAVGPDIVVGPALAALGLVGRLLGKGPR